MTRTPFATLLALALVTPLFFACDSGSSEGGASAAQQENGRRVDGAEARRLVAEEDAFLLDVRTTGEFGGGHIEGATNIPVQELSARLADVPDDKPVVVYCQSGGRSANAARELVASGRTVYDLGGIGDW